MTKGSLPHLSTQNRPVRTRHNFSQKTNVGFRRFAPNSCQSGTHPIPDLGLVDEERPLCAQLRHSNSLPLHVWSSDCFPTAISIPLSTKGGDRKKDALQATKYCRSANALRGNT
jgi:hypothetical protein